MESYFKQLLVHSNSEIAEMEMSTFRDVVIFCRGRDVGASRPRPHPCAMAKDTSVIVVADVCAF